MGVVPGDSSIGLTRGSPTMQVVSLVQGGPDTKHVYIVHRLPSVCTDKANTTCTYCVTREKCVTDSAP